MDEVRCTGNESQLIECEFSGWGRHDCKQNEEVGVKCAHIAPIIDKPKWNLLKLNFKQNELKAMTRVGS